MLAFHYLALVHRNNLSRHALDAFTKKTPESRYNKVGSAVAFGFNIQLYKEQCQQKV